MRNSPTAFRTLPRSFSKANSGVCTPMTTRPLSLYLSAHARIYGKVRRQLIQEYVQKSTRTTFPFSSSRFNGGELSHATAPERSGSVCGPAGLPDAVEDIIIMLGFLG